MDPNNEVNKNIASAYLEMLALEEKKKNEGLDPVNKDAVKKNFKDRKDKDIDNDGDEDESDEYLHNRRKTVSKAIDKDGEVDQDKPKVTSSDADSEKDNDDDRDEKGSVLKKDNDKKKTAEQTKESVELDEASLIPQLQTIVKDKQHAKIKGMIVDTFTASMITQIYSKVNDANKAKMDKLPLEKLVNIAHKMMQKEDMMESVDGENLKELGLEILDKMSEAKKPVSQMTPKEKEDDAARRKEYNAYQKSKRGDTKEEGIIDRLLAGKPKGGAKHWVTKKPDTKESVEPSLLMKRIQEKHGLVEKRVGDAEQNIDTWDKQVSNRRADDVLDTEMTEKEFMDMHNVDTPEFVDGPKVANKSMDAIKNSVKSKSATRNNDSSIGESVELGENNWKKLNDTSNYFKMLALDGMGTETNKSISKVGTELEYLDTKRGKKHKGVITKIDGKGYEVIKVDNSAKKERFTFYNMDKADKIIGIDKDDRSKPVKEENDMYEGMTPMQRALAKVKAQSKDKVSVKKAPWDKDDVKKESVDIESVNEVFGKLYEAKDFKSTFDDLKKGDTVKITYGGIFSSRGKKGTFKVTAKSIVTKFKIGKITLVKQGEGDTEDKYYLYDRNGEVSMSEDDMGPKGISRDHNMTRLKKESVELDDIENINEMYIGQQWHRPHRRGDGIATDLNWYSDLHRTLKRLEDDMQDRKKRLAQELGGSSNSAYEKKNSLAIIKGHIDPTIKAIADVKKTLPPVVKAWAKAYNEAKDADTAVDIIMRKTPAERGHK